MINKNEFIKQKPIDYRNRGMFLESLINQTNQYYLDNNYALIYKKPTPIKVVKINCQNKIIEAYFEKASTSDYNGVYKGFYIDFEAKSTTNHTSFPLNNYTEKELTHLKKVLNHNGISFTIIYFSKLNKFYLYETRKMVEYLNSNNRRSIPLEEIEENGYLLNQGIKIPLDYLKIVDFILYDYA